MKKITLKILFIICLFPFLEITGQVSKSQWAAKINETFAGIDKNRVPHSLLLDYAMEFTDLSVYNTSLNSTNYVSRGRLKSIYNSLVMARVKTTVPGLISPKLFDQNWNNLRERGTIVLSGLYYKYSKFKDDAYPNDITVSNNKLYDKYVNSVWQNPYEEKKVFAIGPPIAKYNGLNVNVTLPQSLWYSNQGSTVQNIKIDFGDGSGYVTMPFGSNYNLQYAEEGVYDWKYKLTLTNGQVLYSHSKMMFAETAPTASWASHKQN